MINKAILWFRNDLRIHDNEALHEAIRMADEVLPVYVFDDRTFQGNTSYGFDKTGKYRAKFIEEAVTNLRQSLQSLGSDLIVRSGIAEDVIFDMADQCGCSWVICNRERTQEEVDVQDALEQKLWTKGIEMRYTRGKMLYYTADLPFPITHTPDTFTGFRKEVEKFVSIRQPLDVPEAIVPVSCIKDFGEIPAMEDISSTSYSFKGGESAALDQLNYYLWKTDLIQSYKKTRNELLGWEFSSKLSAYLAHGCLSPKRIYHEVKKYESERGANDSTYWLIFELLWRDYFRLVGKKYGNGIFKLDGIQDEEIPNWSEDRDKFDKWARGETGVPIVDACMRELNATGFMSNRGRQNCASFLVHDMKINWLMGAEYFESLLVDYDPCSNYGNWNYIAGVGVDPRGDRWFNVVHQGKKYDVGGAHARHWLPEISEVPSTHIHEVPIMDNEKLQGYNIKLGKDYPEAILLDRRWY